MGLDHTGQKNKKPCILSNQDADWYIDNTATSNYTSAIRAGGEEGIQLTKQVKAHGRVRWSEFISAWRASSWSTARIL